MQMCQAIIDYLGVRIYFVSLFSSKNNLSKKKLGLTDNTEERAKYIYIYILTIKETV
jgi:hypothetical protein